MKILQKMIEIKNLPESTRKIILWSVTIALSLGLFALYAKNVQEKLKSFESKKTKEELQLPSFQEEFEKLKKIDFPKIETEIKSGI